MFGPNDEFLPFRVKKIEKMVKKYGCIWSIHVSLIVKSFRTGGGKLSALEFRSYLPVIHNFRHWSLDMILTRFEKVVDQA